MKFSHFFHFSTATLLALSSQQSFAKVTLFQAEKPPQVIDESISSKKSSLSITSLKEGEFLGADFAEKTVRDFINAHQEALGIHFMNNSDLMLTRTDKTPEGLALRFSQLHTGLPVEGAEFIALFNTRKELHSVSSSLLSTETISPTAELSQTEGLAIAKAHLSIQTTLETSNSGGILKIAFSKSRGFLVWEFIVSNSEDPSPVKVQVIAAGMRKGEILKSLPLSTGVMKNSVKIYDASSAFLFPNPMYKGLLVLKNGKRRALGFFHVAKEAKHANNNFRYVTDFYRTVFGRESYDGQGAPIVASVNAMKWTPRLDILKMRENARWMGPFKMFSFGSGGAHLGSFAESLDVVAHEFTHAVIGTSSTLEYQGQSGALNEHLADVFGAMIENQFQPSDIPFLIGEKTLRGDLKTKAKALRDMMNPHRSLGGQPAHMREISADYNSACEPTQDNDNCGVHDISGVPNRAAALFIQALGFEPTARMFYRVMTVRLRATSDFDDYRDQMLDECELTLQPEQCATVKASFAAVGL